jgi:sugar lactone lactonase YvrE
VLTIAGSAGPFTDAQNGNTTIWSLGNVPSTTGSSVAGSSAKFMFPQGVAIDNQNRLYVVDSGNMSIKQVLTTSPYTTTTINTSGTTTYYTIACDGTNLYAASTTSIVKLSPSGTSWLQTQITGTFTSINAIVWRTDKLLVFDNNGIYFISPTSPKRLFKDGNNITSRMITGDGAQTGGIVFDRNNSLYFNDYTLDNTGPKHARIRKISPYSEFCV